jgi:hypothetical protein
MHSHSIDDFRHSHVFLGVAHERNERKTWAVIAVCAVMMVAEIVGGFWFGSVALIADGLHMSTHAGALLIAALAYTYQRQVPKSFWLMYDFGGGTFDAALVRFNDGIGQVVNHGGDNQLGGGDIDSLIVDHLLVPELQRSYCLNDFNRGNARWNGAFA